MTDPDPEQDKTPHEQLKGVVRTLPTDFKPYGKRERTGPDCSCGCRWFRPLEGKEGADWGVCANPDSPRAGLLTFEHQGCPAFEGEEFEPEEGLP